MNKTSRLINGPEVVLDMLSDVSSAISYGFSAFVALLGAMTANEIAAIGGLLCGIATFATNLVFKYLAFRLDRRRTRFEVLGETQNGKDQD